MIESSIYFGVGDLVQCVDAQTLNPKPTNAYQTYKFKFK